MKANMKNNHDSIVPAGLTASRIDWRKTMKRLSVLLLALCAGTSLALAGEVTGKVPQGTKPDNAVVFLKGNFAKAQLPKVKLEIDQKGLKFVPHVSVVTEGSTVKFLNSDSVKHNVFAVGAETFNLGTWGPGASREKTLTHPGEIALLCSIHPEMSAYIYVVDSPYFTKPDASGSFTIKDVPPGSYTLVIYRPEKKLIKKKIDVRKEVAAVSSTKH